MLNVGDMVVVLEKTVMATVQTTVQMHKQLKSRTEGCSNKLRE